jgi:endonuclease/exonuclease/phosphatase family metal-dependent hydrolase
MSVSPTISLNSLRVSEPLYVSSVQKFFIYSGYYANEFARMSFRSIERLTRPMSQGDSYWTEIGERIQKTVSVIFSIPLAAVLFIPAFSCYALAACIGRGRFEYLQPKLPENSWQEQSVKVMSLNAAFQDPWSPLTAGVVPPFERVADCASRVAAVANAIAQENPVVYLGQEIDDLRTQDKLIQLMKLKGFHYFFRDLGDDPTKNHSGLFVASKVPLQDIKFVPYLAEDRAGLAKWSQQGVLAFSILLRGRDLRLVNVHLNYGEGQKNQEARNRQLTRYVLPLLNRENSALFGDLNFNTALVGPAVLKPLRFVNVIEGRVTCTDAGKHPLRGKSMKPDGKPCADCEERIDALICNPDQIQVLDVKVKPLTLGGQPLSDHYATIATLQIS